MSDTADHLEREVEAKRANVESTLDALKERMSVNQVIDEVGSFIGVEDVRGLVNTAGRQVRDNPIALGMIGLGLAWLVMGSGSSRKSDGYRSRSEIDYDGYRSSRSHEPYSGTGPSRDWRSDRDYRDQGRGVIGKVVGAVSGAAESVSHAASVAGEKLSSTLTGTRERAADIRDTAYDRAEHWREAAYDQTGDMRHRVADGAGHLRDRAADLRDSVTDRAEHMRDSVANRMEQQPLLVGAVAIVVGAVIGAALPRTRTENRLMGRYRDDLMDEARAASSGLRDRAMAAAKDSYEAGVDAARDEGLVPESGDTIAAKLERVATAAVNEAKDQVEPMLLGEAAKPETPAYGGSSGSAGTSSMNDAKRKV